MEESADVPQPDEELRLAREAARLSQAQAAQALGVDTMTVSRWERGVRAIKPRDRTALLSLYEHMLREHVPLTRDEREELERLRHFARRVSDLLEDVEPITPEPSIARALVVAERLPTSGEDFPASADYVQPLESPAPAKKRRRRRGKG